MKIALAGNPNSGKTTLFNTLTGSSQYVGNWPGVTVEKKEGKLKGHTDVTIQDLPGIYSLSPYTLEEVVSRNYLINDKPDAIINIVDGTNLERNLYLTMQLQETGIPMVVAINMMDIVEKNGDKIDAAKLSNALGCKVVEISALKSSGLKQLLDAALEAPKTSSPSRPYEFSTDIEQAVAKVNEIVPGQTRFSDIKILEDDSELLKQIQLSDSQKASISALIKELETKHDDDMESVIANERYTIIAKIISNSYVKVKQGQLSTSDKIDKVVTNRFLALPIFVLVMFAMYSISITGVGAIMTDWVNDVLFGEIIPPAIEGFLVGINCAPWLISLIVDGIVAGVGAVLGFLPQMMVLFLCLAILEDCGYMARIAFIMDRIFRKFGLSGKSFIPMLVATGCGVPGIMASRTIENESDRKMTIMTTTFMPCGAKLPIIALIAGALFNGSSWVATSAYFVGIAAIIVSGIILKKTKTFAGEASPFVMELPAYHIPSVKGVLIHMWDRAKSFVKKAGTIILLATILVWFLSSFNFSFQMVDTEESMLASIGHIIAPLFAPLGWGDWKAAVATFTGLIAKENVVGTMGVLYGFGEVAEDGSEMWSQFAGSFTALSAYSFLVFNLLCAPCFAAIGAIRREMGSAKWTWIAVGYQCGLAYVVSFIIYQFGVVFQGGSFSLATVLAILLVVGFVYLLFRPAPKIEKENLLATTAAAAK